MRVNVSTTHVVVPELAYKHKTVYREDLRINVLDMKYERKKWENMYKKMLDEFGNTTVSESLLLELGTIEEQIQELQKENLFNSPSKDLSIVSTHYLSGATHSKELRAGLFLSGRQLETPHCWSKASNYISANFVSAQHIRTHFHSPSITPSSSKRSKGQTPHRKVAKTVARARKNSQALSPIQDIDQQNHIIDSSPRK
jgi:hypothetical protein